MYVCPNCNRKVLPLATKVRACWHPPTICPSCGAPLVLSAVAVLPAIFIMPGALLALTYASMRWKGSIPFWIALMALAVILLATTHFGSLEVKEPQTSFLRRFWPVKHPEYYAATLLGIAAEVTVLVWYMLFDFKLRETGWSLSAAANYASYVFEYDEFVRPHFVAMALQPVVSAALAIAYLLEGARRRTFAWLLFAAVCVNAAISGEIHATLLWISLAALPFALQSAIDA